MQRTATPFCLRGADRPARARTRTAVAAVLLALAVAYLVHVVDVAVLRGAASGVMASPVPVLAALLAYAGAFALRTAAWCRLLPGLGGGQSWAALHVSLLGNHVLPLRLGEVLRVTSVLRRTDLPLRSVLGSTVALRAADLLAVIVLAVVAAPAVLDGPDGVLGRGWALGLAGALLVVAVVAVRWARRGAGDELGVRQRVRLPGPAVASAVVAAWLLESTIVLAVAGAAGVPLSYAEAVAVTAVTIVAQAFALTPGGFGSYEAAGTAGLVAVGVPAADALAVVLLTHTLKTAYALVVGTVALVTPAPGHFGRWRLPRRLPSRPAPVADDPAAPVVVFMPARDEEATVGEVVRRLPRRVGGRAVRVLVVDDGSADATAQRAVEAGARVIGVHPGRGLGAAVRTGLAEALAYRPACVVYVDADLEYDPGDLPALAAPVLAGVADYVVGSRFDGTIEVMRPHRRLGNRVLTCWVRWMTRRRDLTDGQSGYRAFAPAAAAAAEVVHDYNYAQVLTLDLLAKGFAYAEVPIGYSFRTRGASFVRLGRYLRAVVPAVHAELNDRCRSALDPCDLSAE